ncbi:MAG: sialate O-acetylesterase [Verrucomicrobiota bacterium]
MKLSIIFLFPVLASAAEITLNSPLEHQVVQRHSSREGTILVSGSQTGLDLGKARFEAKIGLNGKWQPLTTQTEKAYFSAQVTAPAGGWHRVEVRVTQDGKEVATAVVEEVGVGEVFVVAGQSNSANHGEEKQTTQTRRVAAFDGAKWQIADDPQPGASGRMGSFMPALGDALVKRFDVPVGFIACGIGSTSVREWLPKGIPFPNPPTIESRVVRLADGQWASNGAAFDAFVARMRAFGPNGFRAVLWHQGESDANQKDSTRTLPGKLYSEYLERIIRDSRRDTGFDAPWFVAQASYHVPGDEGSDDIRSAQASLCRDGLAQSGPDSDALKGPLRERNGLGVHFSGPGLREHGQKWMDKIAPWLDQQLSGMRYDSSALPKGHDYFELRDGLANAHRKFQIEGTGRIAFLGGSITAGGGWRDHVMKYFQEKFPDTKFEFIAAGIGSMGSVPHAFRLERDVLSKGPVDLLFVEAAVNDTSNIPDRPDQMLRGMEGVVHHAREVNPLTDIIHMHFVMPPHMDDYHKGKVPSSIAQHEKVAVAYGNPSLNLASEVTDRIDASEFTWDKDFKGLHPSAFGHQLYANSIARMLDAAFSKPVVDTAKPHLLPAMIQSESYGKGRLGSIGEAKILQCFTLETEWKPVDKKGTRSGFVNVPALVGTEPGAAFEFSFTGTGCGLFIASGPDAGRIEFSIDGADFREIETFTQWSAGLHLPWALILDDQLKHGPHTARVRIASGHDAKGTGTALRVFHLLLN